MTFYVLSSDDINGKERQYLSEMESVFKEAGHETLINGVWPNACQAYGLKSESKGKTGVFLVGGSDGGTYQDMVQGLTRGYYHYDVVWFAFASWTASTWITPEDLKNKPLVRAHDDNFSTDVSGFVGKTAAQYFSENSQYIKMAYGDSPKALAEMILRGGGDNNDDGGSASTIKDAIKEVLSNWDGEVECRVVNDTMYINKIPEPTTVDSILELIEGRNVVLDSVTITDVNPDTINFLTVTWPGGEDIILRDEKLISRFGEKPLELEAVKKIEVTETEETSATDTITTTDMATTDTTEPVTETKTTTKTEEVPVETYEEALHFANLEWVKTKRENGHTLECGVIGGPEWQQGKWVKVNLPSFEEDLFMYITKVSHSETDSWDFKLTLTDYPPSFGEPKEETEETSDENSDEDTEENTTEGDG